jgi:hypothetical protein
MIEIGAYNFRGHLLCERCTVERVTEVYSTAVGVARIQGAVVASELPAEIWLESLASVLGFDRALPGTFTSEDFPKVIPARYLNGERCQRCEGPLGQRSQS